jgi:DNA repair protein RecO (recombination protein O)
MPIRHSEAIVLRTYRVGEADKVVVFLTREHGKIQGLAKGARRPRSRFGGSLEIGTELDLTFFEKESRELVSVDRCDIIRSGFPSSGDPFLACTLAYFADLVDSFAPEREPNEKLYRLLRACANALIGGGEPTRLTRYFEAWVLRLGGFYPTSESCSTCGETLDRQGAHYVIEEQRLRCARCAQQAKTARKASDGLSLAPATLRYLKQVWQRPPDELPAPETPGVLVELALLHRRLVAQQLDKELPSLQILDDLIRLENRT